jgi:DNA-binding beta-propeller fold protein YncE
MIKKIFFTTLLLLPLVNGMGQSQAASPWIFEFIMQGRGSDGLGMQSPSGLFVEPVKKRYYVADSGNNRILAYDREGDFLKAFDADGQLLVPYDLVRAGNFIWIVEKGKNSLTNSLFDGEQLLYPDRVAMESGTIYVLDKAGGAVYALTENLDVGQRFACGECDGGFVDFKIRNNSLWALEQKSRTVYQFALDGSQQKKVALDETVLAFPRSLEVDDAGFLYVLDRHEGSVAIFDRGGTYRYSFMGPGQARGLTYYPIELQFDPWGRLCIVDEGNGRVQVFSRR